MAGRFPAKKADGALQSADRKGHLAPPLRMIARGPAVERGSAALRLLHAFEVALDALAAVEPRAGDLALVLALARDRLDRHHLAPYRSILEEHGLERAA